MDHWTASGILTSSVSSILPSWIIELYQCRVTSWDRGVSFSTFRSLWPSIASWNTRGVSFLAHLLRAKWAYGMAHRPSIIRPLNDFFSKTTSLISTKFGRKYLYWMGIQMCSNQGAGPLVGHLRGKKWEMLTNI